MAKNEDGTGLLFKAKVALEALWNRLGNLLDQFSPGECGHYFRHGGYTVHG